MKSSVQISGLSLLVLVCILPGQKANGQTEARIVATTKTSLEVVSPAKTEKNTPKRHTVHIVTTDIRNIGYGNMCVAEETNRMGFEYTPMPVSAIEKRSVFYYFIHNQTAKFKVTLKNGPFWQHKLKKRIKKCRQMTGDFTG